MANGDRPHFRITPEQTYTDPTRRTGFTTPIERADHGDHGRVLVQKAQQFREAASAARDSTAARQYFLEVTVAEATSIRSEKPRLRQAGFEVVSFSRRDERKGTARIDRASYDDLEGRLLRYAITPDHQGRSYFAVLEDLSPVPVEEKVPPDLIDEPPPRLDAILYLYSDLSRRETTAVIDELRRYLEEVGGEFRSAHRFSSGVTTVRAVLPGAHLGSLGQEFTTLRLVAPNRTFFVEDSTPYAWIPNPVAVLPPASRWGVAVVDSGIRPTCPLLAPAISGVTAALPKGAVAPALDHGTFVASRIVFGDDIEAVIRNPPVVPSCRVHDIQVFGVDSFGRGVPADEHDLAVALDTALPQLPPETRIVNLSLGTNEAIRDNEYSLVAATLDHLAREHGLLVVTTSGNVRDPRLIGAFPGSLSDAGFRIDPPGESLLAVTVGSIAKFGDPSTFSQPGDLSPFSRVGPGADGGLKPELVAHGGNYVRPGHPHSRFAAQGIHSDGEHLAWDTGTSFAAPLVARAAAQIQAAYGGLGANPLKALLCHFTEGCRVPGLGDDSTKVGLGEPIARSAIVARDHSASFLFSGDIDVQNYLHVPFFVPEALGGRDRRGRLRIRGTVVYDPPVDASNPTEYSKARLAVTLRKPVQVGFRDVPLGGAFKAFQPWNPLIHFDKPFTHSYEAGEWELRLRLYTRDLPDTFRQTLSVVLEVIDEWGSLDVWGDVLAETGGAFAPVTLIAAA